MKTMQHCKISEKGGKFKKTNKHVYEMLWYGGSRCKNVIFQPRDDFGSYVNRGKSHN